MKFKYEVVYCVREIRKVAITKETAQCVFVPYGAGESKRAKVSDYSSYFDTFTEAHCHLLSTLEKGVSDTEKRLEVLRKSLEKAQTITEKDTDTEE